MSAGRQEREEIKTLSCCHFFWSRGESASFKENLIVLSDIFFVFTLTKSIINYVSLSIITDEIMRSDKTDDDDIDDRNDNRGFNHDVL
jgi:hypothetical protein